MSTDNLVFSELANNKMVHLLEDVAARLFLGLQFCSSLSHQGFWSAPHLPDNIPAFLTPPLLRTRNPFPAAGANDHTLPISRQTFNIKVGCTYRFKLPVVRHSSTFSIDQPPNDATWILEELVSGHIAGIVDTRCLERGPCKP